MDVSVENMGSLGRRVKISVPDSQISDKCRSKMAELAKQVRIKGFRPGKVPKNILEQRYGQSVRAEVVGEVIQSSLTDALKDKELKPAGTPTIEDITDESGKPLEYVATFEVFPEITLADLSEVEIEKKVVDITDKDIQETMDKMAEQMADWKKTERASKESDKLDIDLERTSVEGDDAENPPQKFEHVDFVLDKTKSLPMLVDVLIGKEAGIDESFEVAYPDDWHDEKLAGKKATFKVKIHEVQEKQTLSVEDLAEKLDLDKTDQDGLKQKIKDRMSKEAAKVLHEDIKERVLEILLDKNKFDKPQALLKQEKEALQREIDHKKQSGMLGDDLSDEELDELAEKRVVLGLLINEVINKNNIKVNNQRVRETIAEQAANFPDPKRFISYYYNNKELLQGIERLVMLDQAVEVLLEGMKVVEKPIGYSEAMNPPEEDEGDEK